MSVKPRTLNRIASGIAVDFGVQACTDVTGFGLVGHLVEMARASQRRIRLTADKVPLLAGAMEAVAMGLVPAGTHANRNYFSAWTAMDLPVSPETSDLLHDPQTSGGLILGISGDRAPDLIKALLGAGVDVVAEIGEVVDHDPEGALVII